jgi:hypothetical protein
VGIQGEFLIPISEFPSASGKAGGGGGSAVRSVMWGGVESCKLSEFSESPNSGSSPTK